MNLRSRIFLDRHSGATLFQTEYHHRHHHILDPVLSNMNERKNMNQRKEAQPSNYNTSKD